MPRTEGVRGIVRFGRAWAQLSPAAFIIAAIAGPAALLPNPAFSTSAETAMLKSAGIS